MIQISLLDEEMRVADYDKWKTTKDRAGKTNEDKLTEYNEINREFKKHGEEGRIHYRGNRPSGMGVECDRQCSQAPGGRGEEGQPDGRHRSGSNGDDGAQRSADPAV